MRARQDIMLRDERSALAPMPPSAPVLPPELPEPSIFKAIWRHFWMVIVCALLGAGGAIFYIRHAQPLYLSESLIFIEPMGPKVLNDSIGSPQRGSYLYNQVQRIMSTPILQKVAETPGIRELPTFQTSGIEPIHYLRDQLSAEVGRRDDLVAVSIASPYPEDAATIVNAVVDAYVKDQNRERATAASGILGMLEKRKADAEADRAKLDDQITAFKRSNPNLVVDPIFHDQLAALSHAYMEAQIQKFEAEARVGQNHPTVVQARRREADLYEQYEKKLKEVMGLSVMGADFEKMNADLESKKSFISQLEKRIQELEITRQADQVFNHVDTVEPAHVADIPSFPRTKRTMALAIAAGMLLGAGLALVRDRLDGRMRSVEEIQTVIGLPILGVVPAMGGRRTAIARAMAVHIDPRSPVAEAYRTIRTAVYFGVDGARCKTILITSPEPGDGKTTSASNLAIAIAQTGRNVLLLDADFRKPSQHKNMELEGGIGLSSVLAGHETLDKAIQHTGVEGLHILPCGPIPANPSEILNSREFGELVDLLAARFDHIIFDSPPVNAVTDARILGAVCDATILVLRADKSTRKAGEHARNALLSVGARVLGAIVNDAPNKRGYEVYGGHYYGSNEPQVNSPEQYQGNGRGTVRASASDAVI